MAKNFLKAGSTSRTAYVFIPDSSSTTGAGRTGLVYNTANLAAHYVRDRAAPVDITLATQTVTGAWSSGGFVEVDATKSPGLYRIDLPDAAVAVGVNKVILVIRGASNVPVTYFEYPLVAYDPDDAASLGLSRIDNTITSRMATFTLPTNFSSLSINGSGFVTYANSAPPTAAAISTDIFTKLLSNSDFSTASSFGKLIKDNVDATISSKMATFTLPANFSSLVINGSGFVTYSNAGPPTTSQISSAIWTDTAGDFATANSPGKLLFDNLNATVSSRMATFSLPANFSTLVVNGSGFVTYSNSPPPTTAQICTEIMTKLLSHGDFSTASSFGKLVKDMLTDLDTMTENNGGGSVRYTTASLALSPAGGGGGGSDPLLNAVPGSYAGGTAGYALGRLFGTGIIQIVAPVAATGEIRLIRGDSYYQADSRALLFSSDSASWPDLSGSSVAINIKHSGGILSVACTVTGSYSLRAELSTANTDTLPVGSWPFDLEATLANSHKVTLATSLCIVADDQS